MGKPTGGTPSATHLPTQAEMERMIVFDGTPHEISTAVLRGGAVGGEPAIFRNADPKKVG